MESLSIPDILNQVQIGQIRIPKFQRGFVWEPERVAYLMDSIYKKYPVGSVLFWRTSEKLKDERNLEPFVLPDPKKDFPIDYVLDGQQRITSIFGVFQTELEQDGTVEWLPVYFDIDSGNSPQDARFVALRPDELVPGKHFPLSSFFNTSAYGKLSRSVEEPVAEILDKVREVFQTARIPVDTTNTEYKSTVAIIFERVNRQGVELDTFQLLTAWTWSEDFQLQDQFIELADEIKPFGFGELGDDTNLILRCCSAILTGDSSPDALMNINGELLRDNFDLVTNGIKGAIDFLKANVGVAKLVNLPYATLMVPLSVLFAIKGSKQLSISDAQRQTILRWFWRASFSRRYSSGVIRNLNTDVAEIIKLKSGDPSQLGEFQVEIPEDFFYRNIFGMGNVNTKTFILLLAKFSPLNLISGQPINLDEKLKEYNRLEFHHLMPKKFLSDTSQNFASESVLANFVFLAREENRKIGGRAPSVYRADLPEDVQPILERNLVTPSLFDDNFEAFVLERAGNLRAIALELCQIKELEAQGS